MVGLQEAEKSMPIARDSALGSETDPAEKPRKDADRLNTTIDGLTDGVEVVDLFGIKFAGKHLA